MLYWFPNCTWINETFSRTVPLDYCSYRPSLVAWKKTNKQTNNDKRLIPYCVCVCLCVCPFIECCVSQMTVWVLLCLHFPVLHFSLPYQYTQQLKKTIWYEPGQPDCEAFKFPGYLISFTAIHLYFLIWGFRNLFRGKLTFSVATLNYTYLIGPGDQAVNGLKYNAQRQTTVECKGIRIFIYLFINNPDELYTICVTFTCWNYLCRIEFFL